ncbi:hypothetical protein BKA67DRAFT_646847 [Truncatella angustata]|uniref:Protein kinase domain-containing protein n=1 Tax=Truncatella angustata TaxID=152316 RepID=A0A9P8ZXB5_9PEZI|nr:uncharacterized protein BKA67DRAFT_646847 [Truncatella angustata]KAH6652834.1 hypothetical protein BKA67DRAFT_646847 [Truncatella angustata]
MVPVPASLPAPVPVGFVKVEPGMNLERNAIAKASLEYKYDIVNIIDPGNGTKGAMNASVFVKNFREENDHIIEMIKREIRIIRALKCNSLVQYVNGFIQEDPFEANVYNGNLVE